MSLTYPIASNAMDALLNPVGMERTLTAAKATAGRAVVFENEWIRPGPERVEELSSAVQMAAAHGAVQVYESEKGKPVIALKYWRILTDEELAPKPEPEPEKPEDVGAKKKDHTDDLYFRKGRTKPRKRVVDPNQMDLFVKPEDEAQASKDDDA